MSTSQHLKAHPPMKVLLVEDSVLIRDTLIDILDGSDDLSIAGVAATQNKAIELLDKEQFDMLLVDIELSQGNGFEVIKHTLEESYPYPKPVLVMLTNHAHPQYRSLAKNLGVKYFFDKSMDFDLAIEMIEYEATQFSNTAN
jgi:DNA-binding NarL/FixJ family response regulator